jgi:hypothetical protein
MAKHAAAVGEWELTQFGCSERFVVMGWSVEVGFDSEACGREELFV